MDIYDNTKLSCYKECPRRYFLRHVLHWTVDSGRKSPPLVFGSSWHSAMDYIWEHGATEPTNALLEGGMHNFFQQWAEDGYHELSMEEQDDLMPRTPGVAREMLYNYVATRIKVISQCKVLGVEKPIGMPMPHHPNSLYVGNLDKIIEYNGIHVIEHKSTTAYSISQGFQLDYMESWGMSSQVKGYAIIGSLYYPELQDVWVDCALVHKKVHDQFKFIPIQHSIDILAEWVEDTSGWIGRVEKDMEKYKANGDLREGCFPKNEESCFGKFGRCAFLPICNIHADPTKLGKIPHFFKEEKWEPFNEEIINKIVGEADEKNS